MERKKTNIKKVKKGKFYHFHEGSPTGHPGLIYWKNDKKNLYLAVTTDSTPGAHRTKLTHPTSKDVSESYINNHPLLAKRKNIGGERINMKFDTEDKPLVKTVSRRPNRETKDINRKDRRYIKRLKKKPKY